MNWELARNVAATFQSSLASIDWELARNVTATFRNFLTAIAVPLAAGWAYFRFARFRTLKPRLDLSFEFRKANSSGDGGAGIVVLKATNQGNTKVDLRTHARKHAKHRCFLKCGLINIPESTDEVSVISQESAQLQSVDTVFTAHKWIEPGETIDDVKVLHIPDQGCSVIQLELQIFGKQKWSSMAAFPVTKDTTAYTATSEDEQDDYEEIEPIIGDLEQNLRKAKEKIRETSTTPEQKESLQALIEEGETVLSRLKSWVPSSSIAIDLEQPEQLTRELEKELRASVNRLATFCAWQLSKRFDSLFSVA